MRVLVPRPPLRAGPAGHAGAARKRATTELILGFERRAMLAEDRVWRRLQPAGVLRSGNPELRRCVQASPLLLELLLGRVVAQVETVDLPELGLIDHVVLVDVEQGKDQICGVLSLAILPQQEQERLELPEGEGVVPIYIRLAQAVLTRPVHGHFRSCIGDPPHAAASARHDGRTHDGTELLAVELLPRNGAAAVSVHAPPHPGAPIMMLARRDRTLLRDEARHPNGRSSPLGAPRGP
mmetsp:Transcript_43791/g.91091  ORF Transcript_43791/g.91091 Transcript_43791/m.91091 type:complete len:238 (-) Transcript_43791:2-715(-)